MIGSLIYVRVSGFYFLPVLEGKPDVVLGIDRDVVTLVRGRVPIGILGISLLVPLLRKCHGREGLRQKSMMDVLGAELHEVAGRRHIVEVQLPAPVPDAREKVMVNEMLTWGCSAFR